LSRNNWGIDTKMASGHISQTFRTLPGVGLDKVAKIKGEIVIPIPIKRSA